MLRKLRFALRAWTSRAATVRRAALVVAALVALLALPVVAGVAKRGPGHQQRGHRPPGLTKSELPRIPRSLLPRTAQSQPRSSVAARRRSRTAHHGRSRIRALALLRRRFPQVAAIPNAATPQLPAGARVEQYLGRYSERIVLPKTGRRQVVVSPLPVRAKPQGGRRARVSLGLQKEGDAFEPVNPLVDLALPEQLGDGVAIGDDGVRIKPASQQAADVTGTPDQDQVLYPNTGTDQDTLVTPAPTGVEVFTQLRSPDAPEAQVLEFDLPAGAELRATEDGGAEVVRAGERLVRVFKPAAADSDGRPVPTSYSVDGNRLTVHAEHRGGDYAYPILVDPLLEDWGSRSGWADSWFYNPGSDISGWFFADSPQNSLFATVWGLFAPVSYGSGYGLYALAPPDTYFPAGSYGEWLWRAPGQTTFIPRADFGLMYRNTQADTKNQSVLVDGIYSESQHRFTGYHQFNGRVMGQSDVVLPGANVAGANPRAGNLALFALAFPFDHKRKTWTTAYLGGAGIYLDDPEAPTITEAPPSSASPAWIDPDQGSARVTATDPGLGVQSLTLTARMPDGRTPTDVETTNCDGTRFFRCPPSATIHFGYARLGLTDGTTTMSATASDPLGHTSQPSSWQVRADSSRPSLTLSGRLHDAAGSWLDDQDYPLQIEARDGSATRPSSGVRSVEVLVDSERVDYVQQPCDGSCPLSRAYTLHAADYAEGIHDIHVTATDQLGHTMSQTWSVKIDRTDPVLNLSGTLKDHADEWLRGGSYALTAHATDSGSGAKSIEFLVDGVQKDYEEQQCAAGGCSLSRTLQLNTADYDEGRHEVQVRATDQSGRVVTSAVTTKIDHTPPIFSLSGSLKDLDGQTLTANSYGLTVNATDSDALGHQSGVQSVEVLVDGQRREFEDQPCDGGGCPMLKNLTFATNDFESGSHVIRVVVADQAGTIAESSWSVSAPARLAGSGPPVAPSLAATGEAPFLDQTKFLYSGSDASQRGVSSQAIADVRAAGIRGRVTTRDGNPLPGVTVTVAGHPEYGSTTTRADGEVYMAVNGGGTLKLEFTRAGYLSAERSVKVPWRDYGFFDDVALVEPDSRRTDILAGPLSTAQVARATPVTDDDGTRQETLVFQAGTEATMRMPNGQTRAIDQLGVRATEFTVGPNGDAAMPAPLPATSAYTYAVDFSVDEAVEAGADEVDFSKPVVSYNENFLGFAVGESVPNGAYDEKRHAWVADQSGRVVKILSESNGLAQLDVTGSGTAASADALAGLGITQDEREKLAQTYDPGVQLWRVPLRHFSRHDFNWGASPADGAISPTLSASAPPVHDPCPLYASKVGCDTQILGESVGLAGSSQQLNYSSDRTIARKSASTIEIPLSGAVVPSVLKRIDLDITVAGRLVHKEFSPGPNKSFTFTWDGKDAYGRELRGAEPVSIELGYVYDAFYIRTGLFGEVTGVSFAIPARLDITLSAELDTFLRGSEGYDTRAEGLGGWTLTDHHFFDAIGSSLYLGDGRKRSAADASQVVDSTAGLGHGSEPTGDGGPANQAGLDGPQDVAVAADGAYYIADFYNDRVRKVDPSGTITTIAGKGNAFTSNRGGFSGDGGPATDAELHGPDGVAVGPDGSVYIADRLNNRVRRVDPQGIITTIAGNGDSRTAGDGGPATAASLGGPNDLAISADGTIWVAAGDLRRIAPDGTISTPLGGGTRLTDDVAPHEAYTLRTQAVALGPDGSVYFTDQELACLRRLTPAGRVRIVAGRCGTFAYSGDGAPATDARLDVPNNVAVAPDGTIFVATSGDERIRRIGADGIITTVAGRGPFLGASSGDKGPASAAVIDTPTGLDVAPDGSLYFGEWGSDKVRRIHNAMPDYTGDNVTVASDDGRKLFVFDRAGRHLATRSTLTGATLRRFNYDFKGRLASMVDGNGNLTRIERDSDGHPSAIVGPYGQRTTLAVDENGYLSSIADPTGHAWRLTTDPGGLLRTLESPRHNTSSFDYDPLGRLVHDADAAGGTKTLTRTAAADGAYDVAMDTGLGRHQSYRTERLSNGDLLRTYRGTNGLQRQMVKTTGGRVTVSAANGLVTTAQLGADSRFGMASPLDSSATSITPGGVRLEIQRSRTATLDDPTNLLSLRSATESKTVNGRTLQTTFDARTRRFKTTTPAGRQSSLDIDALGRPVVSSRSGVLPVAYGRDSRGRLTTVTQGTRSSTVGYDGSGRRSWVRDGLGRETRFEYDAAGRRTRQILPNGDEIGYTYDDDGNIASVTPQGRAADLFSYNPVDRFAGFEPPALPTERTPEQYGYNADRQLASIKQAGGHTVDFGYDSAGRPETITQARGVTRTTYDPQTGERAALTAPGGERLAFGWDGPLLTSQTSSGTVTGSVGWNYNSNYLVASQRVNDGQAIGYSYDADDLLTAAGDLGISRSSADGSITGTTLGGVGTSSSYDEYGGLSNASAFANGTPIYGETYVRDRIGRIAQKTEHRGNTSTAYGYHYDGLGRLDTVTRDGATVATYRYDTNGNRVEAARAGELPTSGTYDGQDRLTAYGDASYTYDPNGSLRTRTRGGRTTGYSYDELGALTGVALPDGRNIDYVIDGLGRRIAKKLDGQVVQRLLYGRGLAPVAELNDDNSIRSRFVYGTRPNVPDYMLRDGRTYRFVVDHAGSPRAIVDVATGQVAEEIDYDEFGRVTHDSKPGFQPFGFAGGLYDEDTGLTRFGTRDYDAETGRWTRRDPLLLGGGDTNFYAYVLSDPVNLVDPLGTAPAADVFCADPHSPLPFPPEFDSSDDDSSNDPPPPPKPPKEPCDAEMLGRSNQGPVPLAALNGTGAALAARSSDPFSPDYDPDCANEHGGEPSEDVPPLDTPQPPDVPRGPQNPVPVEPTPAPIEPEPVPLIP